MKKYNKLSQIEHVLKRLGCILDLSIKKLLLWTFITIIKL